MKVRFLQTVSFNNLHNYVVNKGTVCNADEYSESSLTIELPNHRVTVAPKIEIGTAFEVLDDSENV